MNHAQAILIAKALEASRNGSASKNDLAEAVHTLRAEIAAAEARMETRMDARFLVLKAEIDVRFTKLESRMDKIEAELIVMRWCFGLMFALQFGILAKLFFP